MTGTLPACVIHFYKCNEAQGAILADTVGSLDISLSSATGLTWSSDGILTLSTGYFLTPSLQARSMFMVLRQAFGATGGYLMGTPSGKAIGQETSGGTSFASIRSLSGQAAHTLRARTDPNGFGAYELNSGGWVAPLATLTIAETGTFVVGAATTAGAGPASFLEIAALGYCDTDPTTNEAEQIRTYLRAMLTSREIYIAPQDCPTRADLLVIAGESASEGTLPLTNLSSSERATFSENTFILALNAASQNLTTRSMDRLSFSTISANNNALSTGTRFGMEWGLLVARNKRASEGNPLHILKVGQGSTYSLPSGTYTDASGAPYVIDTSVSRNSGEYTSTTNGLHYTLEMRNYYRVEAQARNDGIGYSSVTFIENDGANDAYVGDLGVTSAAQYQGYLQGRYNARSTDYGLTDVKTVMIYPHLPQGGLGGGDPDYPAGAVGQNRLNALMAIRAGIAGFITANATNVSGFSTDDFVRYPLNNTPPNIDWVHWNKTGYENLGVDVHALLTPADIPDYSNSSGAGDRTSLIAVTTTTGLFSQSPSNLVDGLFGNNGSESVSFSGGSTAGVYIRFDFGPGASRQITEARWKQSGSHSHGTFQWRGSDDLFGFTDIGEPFTLGGAITQLQTTLSTNDSGYRYYELLGIDGTLSVAPYIQEIEFKIGVALFDNRLLVPTGGGAGEALIKLSDRPGDYAFQPPRRIYPMHTPEILAEWHFDEGEGDRARNIRSGDGTRDIVFDSTFRTTYSSSPQWSRRGLLLQEDMVQTPTIAGVRTVATLYRIKRGDTGAILTGGNGPGAGVFGDVVSTTYEHWIAGGEGIAPLLYNSTVGNVARRLNRGGWLLIFTEFDTGYNTILGWGGRYSSDQYRASEMELAWSACWSGQLDNAERETVFSSVRQIAAEREIYLHWRDCPDHLDCVLLWGQSNVTGYSRIADLTAADQARTFTPNVLVSLLNGTGTGWPMPEDLRFTYNHRIGLADTRLGPLPGAAWAHEDNRANRERKLVVNQSAQDSTFLSDLVSVNISWNAGTLGQDSMLDSALVHWWETEQRLLLRGVGPRIRALWFFLGEEDSTNIIYSTDYGTNISDMWAATKSYLSAYIDNGMKLVKTPVLGPTHGYDTDANNEVRAAQVTFAANESDVELIDCDDLPQQSEDGHFTGPAMKVVGERLYAATDLT